MSVLTELELREIEVANDSGRPVVVFIHGLWLLSSSWDRWRAAFEEAGWSTIAPGWPDDPPTIAEARATPSRFARKKVGAVTKHYLDAIDRLNIQPSLIGHSFGGLIAQRIAGDGAATCTVAIDPAPYRGVLPLPFSSLKAASPVIRNPFNAGRAITLTFDQFNFGWTNVLPEEEARQLYQGFHVAAPGAPLFQAAFANLNPWTEAKVDTQNEDRGPLLIVAGQSDNTVPLAITHAMYKRQARNAGLTEITEIPGRGHSLTIDHGWHEIADIALEFINRTSPTSP
jgi:pimeloyl-ACP methyl ester carboxylesterase